MSFYRHCPPPTQSYVPLLQIFGRTLKVLAVLITLSKVPRKRTGFKSYLSKRREKVYVNGDTCMSDSLMINSGVPQGLILGPFLFLIYINDIVKATNYFSIRLFANDTSLTLIGKDLDLLLQHTNSELPAIHEWLSSNILTLNLLKRS